VCKHIVKYTALHQGSKRRFFMLTAMCTIHYNTLHYTTLHYTTLHYTAPHYTTLHYTTLHHTTHYTLHTTHYTTLHSPGKKRTSLMLTAMCVRRNSCISSASAFARAMRMFSCVCVCVCVRVYVYMCVFDLSSETNMQGEKKTRQTCTFHTQHNTMHPPTHNTTQ
jgi:hypothetical protein